MIEFNISKKESPQNHAEFNCLEVVNKSSPKEFLDYFNLLEPHWGETVKRPWIFRGQADSSWGLVPSAWHPEANQLISEIRYSFVDQITKQWDSVYKDINTSEKFWTKEAVINVLSYTATIYELSYGFAQLADELGHSVPGMQEILSGRQLILNHQWPSHDHTQPAYVFALSQHHGLPTHLLDWTRNPQYAAFFAADSNYVRWLERPDSDQPDLAVWALNLDLIVTDFTYDRSLCPLTCPRSQHNFLHVQDALHLWHPGSDWFCLKEDRWPDFLEIIELDYKRGQPKPVRKVTLKGGPNSRNLLDALLTIRISKAHLMPTLDNIADTLKTTSLIESFERISKKLNE